MNKAKKYMEFITTKCIQKLSERNATIDGITLKYLFYRSKNSPRLIVVFSACTRKGVKARYNYVRTLRNVSGNKLFILDDFAEDNRGAYYLGRNCGNEIEEACRKLIENKMRELHCDRLICCGSSKGGWAALNMMCNFPGSTAIVGAPQYKLGNYIMSPALEITRKYIMPEVTENYISFLNALLSRKLQHASKENHRLYLHYSDIEHTYADHVKFLLEDLEKYGYNTTIDIQHYSDHLEVSQYFPEFLVKSILQEVNS